MTKRVVALTFHDVVADAAVTAKGSDPFYRIRVSECEALVSQLRQRGYQTVSSKLFRAWQQGGASLPRRAVVLTFDDGYASHFDAVVPLLVRHRFTGTFFIAADLVSQPGYMTWEQLRKLVFLGMEIGAHGLSHQPLTEMSADALRRAVPVERHAGGEQREGGEAAAFDRQVRDRFGFDREGPFARRGLHSGCLALDVHDLRGAADLQRQAAERHPGAGIDGNPRAFQRLERRHRDVHGVAVGLHVREDEVAGLVRHDRRGLGSLRLAGQRDRGAGNDAALHVFHRTDDRRGDGLRVRTHGECRDKEERQKQSLAVAWLHKSAIYQHQRAAAIVASV